MLEIKSIEPNQVRNNFLKERIKGASHDTSTEYIALMNNIEVGFISLVFWPTNTTAFIYEIYVLHNYRRKGVGEKLLTFAEDKAAQSHRNPIKLEPNNFDRTITKEKLISWYERHGYRKDNTSDEYWIKSLC
ncbi:GNAT family N-acetyltransferase [Proteus vulgaris]|uniref:GNAT family N-acetyltransferase n=1 Tax=Proteus vulgaris TaxID=585 RepID=UPI002574CD9D|nr:GNAT family N-acetyltransferase [Proteus vulgaris]MDM3565545.1 GNAT family N-acetyltransferase [Proteus vulgaris]